MSMDLHFLAIPRRSYFKARKNPAFAQVDHLTNTGLQAGDSFDTVRDALWEEAQRYSEYMDPKERLAQLEFLVKIGAIPTDELSLDSRQFMPLIDLFEEAPTAFGKCFSGGEQVDDEMDIIWGEDVERLAASLEELETGDEVIDSGIEALQELYARAAEEDWAVLRWMS